MKLIEIIDSHIECIEAAILHIVSRFLHATYTRLEAPLHAIC